MQNAFPLTRILAKIMIKYQSNKTRRNAYNIRRDLEIKTLQDKNRQRSNNMKNRVVKENTMSTYSYPNLLKGRTNGVLQLIDHISNHKKREYVTHNS